MVVILVAVRCPRPNGRLDESALHEKWGMDIVIGVLVKAREKLKSSYPKQPRSSLRIDPDLCIVEGGLA